MSHHTKLNENIEGDDNFRDWKYRISLVLEKNELDSYISEEVPVPEGDEARPYIRRRWLWKIESLLILSRITSYHRCPPSRKLKLCLMPVEAWKFAGNNRKGFSPVNVPNYPMNFWYRESIQFAFQLP